MGDNRFWMLPLIAAICALIVSATAQAIAVSTPVLEQNTLQLPEKSSALFVITLQNVENEDLPVRIDYSSDSDIATILDYKDVYVLAPGSIDNKVTFNITAPLTAKPGNVYEVKFTVAPLRQSAGGTIALKLGISKNFKVEITRNPRTFYFDSYLREKGLFWAFILAVIAAYLWYSYNERHKKRRKGG